MESDTLKSLLPTFIDSLQKLGRSPSTILAYRADLEQLVSFLSSHQKASASKVASTDLANFRDWLLSQKYTPKSASRKLNAVKTLFRWLKEQGTIISDPAKDVSHPKITSVAPKFLLPIEYRALRDVVRGDLRVAAIVEMILQTGMRISEISNLKLDQILKSDNIQIEAYATQPARSVPLNEAAKQALNHYLTERPKSESLYVFVSKNGKPLAVRNIRAAIDRYMQKAEIPNYSVNDLRTTFIVENLKRGVDLVTISQASGHKRLSTTERYLELANLNDPGKKQKLEEL